MSERRKGNETQYKHGGNIGKRGDIVHYRKCPRDLNTDILK